MMSALDDSSLSSDQDINRIFGVGGGFIIQPSETLQIELTRTHRNLLILNLKKKIYLNLNKFEINQSNGRLMNK